MRHLIARLARDRRGIAATEFALILLTQKLQGGAFILADLTARDRTLSEGQLANIFLAIDNIIQPFDFDADGRAIVSSVGVNAANKPVVNWQRLGSGELTATSEVGTQGALATLPDDLSIAAGETIIAAEVFYSFEPLFGIGLSPRVIHKVSYYKPRLGTLDSLLP